MSATTAKPNQNGNQPQRTQNGQERQRVADIQRTRMLTAMAEVAAERGASNVTVAHVVERAGVSRRTFYEIFSDSEDCLLACVNTALARVAERVLPVYRAEGRWRDRIRAALEALLAFFDEEPYVGRLLVVETLAGGRRTLARRTEVLGPVIGAIDEARTEAKPGTAPVPLAAEGVVGAAVSVLHSRMLGEDRRPLTELVNPLMSMIVLPYLGSAAARRELERPIARKAPSARRTSEGSPLKTLDIRLTYRTVRVLAAVAESPASSNRHIAEASDITDQGQISKLLARLEKLGLVENTSIGSAARGEPNAWTLTGRGEEVHRSLAAHAIRPELEPHR